MSKLIFCVFLILVPLISGSNVTTEVESRIRNITEFFPDVKGNLTKVTWAHAVNSQELLEKALNGTVMMLEADIVLGQLNGSQETVPIMAHPPNNTSDLSLQDFLQKVQDSNTKNNTAKKGVKLDFKTIEAFEAFVSSNKLQMDYPVWLNADILPGPVNATDEPVNATRFLNGTKGFENATLSLGWRTRYGGEITNGSYTDEDIVEMVNVIQQNNVSHPITFPVRAAIAAQSLCQLKGIVDNVTDSTLTLWHGQNDTVDIESLRKLIGEVRVGRVYIDLPDELRDQLRLDKLSGVNNVKPFALMSLVLTVLMRLF